MATEITNPGVSVNRGERWLLFFNIRPFGNDVAEKLSDAINVRATWLNNFAGRTGIDFELEGTTVNRARGEFIALVKVQGTPLIAIINPLVQLALIVTAGVVALIFIKAVLVPVGAGVKQTLDSAGGGLEQVGTGLKFALPLVALGIGLFVALNFSAFLLVSRGR